MAEGGGLENRCTREGTVGSNPTSSAMSLLLLKTKQLRLGYSVFANELLTRFRCSISAKAIRESLSFSTGLHSCSSVLRSARANSG